jgi:hypothetical protein
MNKHKGGRGVKAPYSSKVLRIPEPILESVESLLDDFYNGADNPLKNYSLDSTVATAQAKEILEQNKISKRSTKVCLEKLLQVIYADISIKL